MTDPGRDEISRALRILLAPGGVVELRAIAEDGTHSGYFDDPDLAACSAELLSLPPVHGIYVTLNEVNPALLARRQNRVKMRLSRKDQTTADHDILRRRWFPIDIDPVRPSGVSATHEEHERAMEKAGVVVAWLSEQGFPEPVRGDSGNGAHLLYRIDLPNDEASRVLVQHCLATLATLFSDETSTIDTAVYNAARIWKLYGTVSRKGDYTALRPHRRSRLLSVPEEIAVVPRETLVRLASFIPVSDQEDPIARETARERKSSSPPGTGSGPERPVGKIRQGMKVYEDGKVPIPLASWLREHGIGIRAEKPWQGGQLFLLEECPFSTAHTDGAFAIQFGNGAIYAGCHHAGCGGGKQRWQELRAMHENEYTGIRGRNALTESSGTKGANPPDTSEDPPRPEDEEEAVKEKAIDVLRNGNPASFILETFARCHVGDETVAECYLASVLSSSVRNSRGLHVCPTGDSGKGKSNSAHAFLRLLPDEARMQGSISSKALFYHTLSAGTVIIFDDFAMNEDLREVLKNSTSDFQRPLRHFTLNANRQPVILTLPPRCVWWILSVDNPGDDQVLSRMMNPWIDDSEQQDRRVRDHIFSQARLAPGSAQEHPDVAVCRAIFSLIREHLFSVRIPFAHRIRMDSIRNRRNPIILLDLIRSFAVLCFLQREQELLEDGSIRIDAAEEDFIRASRLFSALDTTSGGQTSKLLKNEKLLIDSVLAMKTCEFKVKDVQEWMGLSYSGIRKILHGRFDREGYSGGLLAKCPAVSVVETTESETSPGVSTMRKQNHYLFDYEQYRRWNRGNGIWLVPDTETGGDDDDHDPAVPMGPHRDLTGTSDGTGSNLNINGQNVNPDDSTKNILSTNTICSQNGESAVCQSKQSGRPISSSPAACAFGNSGTDPEIPLQKDETCKIPQKNEDQRFPDLFPKTSRVGTRDPVTLPLPGLLDHRDFLRANVAIGKCDICSRREAVYQNTVTRTKCCAECYGKLVREWNLAQGVG